MRNKASYKRPEKPGPLDLPPAGGWQESGGNHNDLDVIFASTTRTQPPHGLRGRTLELVCFAEYSINLHFGEHTKDYYHRYQTLSASRWKAAWPIRYCPLGRQSP